MKVFNVFFMFYKRKFLFFLIDLLVLFTLILFFFKINLIFIYFSLKIEISNQKFLIKNNQINPYLFHLKKMSRKLTKMLLPYNFKGFFPGGHNIQIRFMTLRAAEENLSPQIHSVFSSIYTSVLTALCDHDLEYLKNVMENRLFERTKEDLEKINEKKLKLNYVEPSEENSESDEEKDEEIKLKKFGNKIYASEKQQNKVLHQVPYAFAEKDMKINLEALGVLGANIDRSLNEAKVITFPGKTRTYYLNLRAPLDIFQKQILVINAYFLTKRKIFVSDEENFVIHGTEDENKWLAHKWRFETYNNKTDWVLSDMDDYLDTNPYYCEK